MKNMTMKGTVAGLAAGCLALIAGGSVAIAQTDDFPALREHREVKIAPLGVNAPEADFAPVSLRGGEILMFTSGRPGAANRSGEERVWMATKSGKGWSQPVPAGEALRHAEHVGGATLTPDGNFMIFAAYRWEDRDDDLRGEGRTDLYSAERIAGEWRNIRNLGPAVNSEHWDSQPSLSSSGRTLYFASNRPGGYGGADIYVSHLGWSGWSSPVNLGSPVNGPMNDMTPSIAPDDASLFFSSNGHGGAGGYDIFVATGDDGDGAGWRSLENVGTPINTPSDEHYFISLPNTKHGYFVSNKGGNFEMYEANPNPHPAGALVTVAGRVIDERTKAPVAATITVTDLGTGETVASYRSDDRSGEYYVILKRGWRYSITAEAPGYIFYSDEYSVPLPSSPRDLKKDIPLQNADGGTTRLLVFFDYDRAQLQPESKSDMERATAFLRQNSGATIEIAGHTDSVGSPAYNKTLSQDRAEAVKRYFVERGIEPGRITARGYGEERPVADNGAEEGRARNRRVEMHVGGRRP